jgi:pseudouridine-5'-phosphate glycosidase
VDTLALAHGVRPEKRRAFLERAGAAANRHGTELIWPVLIDGRLVAKLEPAAFDLLCLRGDFTKIGVSGFGLASVRTRTGGLTAAASLAAGEIFGAEIVVTGGLGGIYRDGINAQSADLYALAVARLPLVCSGFKPFIDPAASIAVLESTSVPIFHFNNGGWPCLYANDPDLYFGELIGNVDEMAAALAAQQQLVRGGGRGLCVLSVPKDAALSWAEVELRCSEAIKAAKLAKVQGSALTPWLLKAMRQSQGRALDVANEAALLNNIATAAALASRLVPTTGY